MRGNNIVKSGFSTTNWLPILNRKEGRRLLKIPVQSCMPFVDCFFAQIVFECIDYEFLANLALECQYHHSDLDIPSHLRLLYLQTLRLVLQSQRRQKSMHSKNMHQIH